jgi:phosphoribosylanthranilate isomerase
MYVKVCGITNLDDALAAAAAGADVLGFNCIPSSKRYVERALLLRLLSDVRRALPSVLTVAVVADLSTRDALGLLDGLGVDRLQLHGDESFADVSALGARAFKAVRIGDASDAAIAAAFPGHPLLVDAKVPGQLGGTGVRIDTALVAPLARARPLILAGGLAPDNVAAAVSAVQPWGVDVASGVEVDGDARRKDHEKLERFVARAREAGRSEHDSRF